MRSDRTIGVFADGESFITVRKFIKDVPVDSADLCKLAARDDNTLVVDNTDLAVDRLSHLIDQSLKKLVAHLPSPFSFYVDVCSQIYTQ